MSLASDILVVTATIEPSVEKEWNEWYKKFISRRSSSAPDFAPRNGMLPRIPMEAAATSASTSYLRLTR